MRENSIVNHGLTRYAIRSCLGGGGGGGGCPDCLLYVDMGAGAANLFYFVCNRQWSQFSFFFNFFLIDPKEFESYKTGLSRNID